MNNIFTEYPEKEILEMAKQCKKCKKECVVGCPLKHDIPTFMKHVKKKDYQSAYNIISAINPMPSVCTRLCHAQCESKCPRGVNIKAIERFVADKHERKHKKSKGGKQIAVIGAGAAGMTAVHNLLSKGHDVTVFEAREKVGGGLYSGVPAFRLPLEILQNDFGFVENATLNTNSVVGTSIGLQKLAKQFDAVIISTGANKPAFLNLPGENLLNVFTVSEFFAMKEYPKEQTHTIVVGGNAAALDAALIAADKGDNVTVVYEKDHSDMVVDKDLLQACKKQGISFLFMTKPTAIRGEKEIEKITFQQMMIKTDEDYGTRVSIPIEDSEFDIECQKLVISAGYEPNQSIRHCNIRTSGKGRVWVNPNYQTTIPNVFASGELIMGSKPIEYVIRNAINVSDNVDKFLKGKLEEFDGY